MVARYTPGVQDFVSFKDDKKADEGITIQKQGEGIVIIASGARRMIAGYGWY